MARANRSPFAGVFSPILIAMEERLCAVRRIIGLFLFVSPVALSATVLEPPSLRCISVGAAGEATLSWSIPSDPTGEFLQYEIFHSVSQAGPFTLVAGITTYGQTFYSDATAGGDTGPQYYYLTTVSTSAPPNTSVSSDTLATIFLQVAQSVPLGSAVLDWNLPHDPPLGSADEWTDIYMEHPLGTWTLVDSVINTIHHWSQVISICEDSLNFRIEQADASGCGSRSNSTGAMFQDITPPSIPIMVNVTVDTMLGQTFVDWDPSPEADTHGYIIVLVTTGGNVILDTIYGQFNTSYQWTGSTPGLGAESYTIAAIDTCWKGSPPSPNTSATFAPHTTIFLSVKYDGCSGTIQGQVDPYAGWPVDHYEVYVQIDGGPFLLQTTLVPDIASFTQTGVQPDRTYCYVVKAIGTVPDHISLSNRACLATNYPQIPQWNYLRVATVAGEGEVLVVDSVDMNAVASNYVLERSYNGLPWEVVATIPGTAGPTWNYSDMEVITSERSYSYRVLVKDSCGSPVVTSNIGTTLLLIASADLDGYNRLRWNGYVQWAGQVGGYTVHRSVDDGPFMIIGTTSAGQWEYDDNVQGLTASNGKFCYWVEATEVGDPSGIDAVSASNPDCAIQEEEVWIPNAFIASGYNNTFIPVLAYADARSYEFTIFNRWGQQIWTTSDKDQAWDGRVGGTFVPQGIYAYYCAFKNGAGKTIERRGTVTFLPGM